MFQKVVLISRVLFGFMFVVAGADGLLREMSGSGLFPVPEMSPEMMAVGAGLAAMKFLMPLVKGLELISGLLFLWGRYLNLALLLIGPVLVNILGINLFVEPSGAPMALVLSLFYVFVLASRWPDFKTLLCKKP